VLCPGVVLLTITTGSMNTCSAKNVQEIPLNIEKPSERDPVWPGPEIPEIDIALTPQKILS
jgi:hypothetical protein